MSVCKAPHSNMYCTVEGWVAPCWMTIVQVGETWSEQNSLSNIWFGEKFQSYRNQDWPERCSQVCKDNVEGHCQLGSLMMAYEQNTVREYPSMIELELSNQCNFECIMCDERLSSGIRKKKGLEPLPMAYTDKFVQEMREFIPHLDELRFNGGEPFAQKIVYDIIDQVLEIKPELKITVATNGSVLNKKVREYIDKGNIALNISIDALTKELYEEIRVNGDFDTLMKNFEKFKEKCYISVQINPMTNNWREMVKFVDFANEHNVDIAYNTVSKPKHLSLMYAEELDIIQQYMSLQAETYPVKNHNWEKFNHLVNSQLAAWADIILRA